MSFAMHVAPALNVAGGSRGATRVGVTFLRDPYAASSPADYANGVHSAPISCGQAPPKLRASAKDEPNSSVKVPPPDGPQPRQSDSPS